MSGSEDIVGREDELVLHGDERHDARVVEATPMNADEITRLRRIETVAHAALNNGNVINGDTGDAAALADALLLPPAPEEEPEPCQFCARRSGHYDGCPAQPVASGETSTVVVTRVTLGTASGETPTPIEFIAAGDANSNASLKNIVQGLRDRATISSFMKDQNFYTDAADLLSRLSEQVEKQGKVVEVLENIVASYEFAKTTLEGPSVPYLYEHMKRAKKALAALNGLVVVGERGDEDDQGLHRPEADDTRGSTVSPNDGGVPSVTVDGRLPCEFAPENHNGTETPCDGPTHFEFMEDHVYCVCFGHLVENRDYWMGRAQTAERVVDVARALRIEGDPDAGLEAELKYVMDWLTDSSIPDGVRLILNNWRGGIGYIKDIRAALREGSK